MSEGHFEAREEDAWTVSAIAGHLLKAQAIYRPTADHLEIYLLVMSTRKIEA